MSKQPEALRLAYLLEVSSDNPTLINVDKRCAAELRRLHEVNQELLEVLKAFSDYVRDEQNSTDGAVCAKVCEEPGWNAADWCAKAIRARGNA